MAAATQVQRRLAHIDTIIEREGVFLIQEGPVLGDFAHNATVEWLGVVSCLLLLVVGGRGLLCQCACDWYNGRCVSSHTPTIIC